MTVPQLNKPQYKVYFYHRITNQIMCYKFKSLNSANDFFDRLDNKLSKPTMYTSERIR